MSELFHSGKKGQKWYVRRYQNYDGTLTPAGRERYRQMRDDNRATAQLTDEAKRYARAAINAMQKVDKYDSIAQRKYRRSAETLMDTHSKSKAKDPNNAYWMDRKRIHEAYADQLLIADTMSHKYKELEDKVVQNREELNKRYGLENVMQVSYKTLESTHFNGFKYIDEDD